MQSVRDSTTIIQKENHLMTVQVVLEITTPLFSMIKNSKTLSKEQKMTLCQNQNIYKEFLP